MHYKKSSGIDIRISFDQVDTSSVSASDFKEVKDKISAGEAGIFDIDTTKSYNTGDLLLGNITLKLEGKLEIGKDGGIKFSGNLKSYDDKYDFNASTHRSVLGEMLTIVGRIIGGKNYQIQIRGSRKIEE